VARQEGAPERYPVKTRRLLRRAQPWWLLVLRDAAGRIWLQRRPARGIWAGLHCVPVFSSRAELMVGVHKLNETNAQITCDKTTLHETKRVAYNAN
jgi:A/G-specific adenine glycosylase